MDDAVEAARRMVAAADKVSATTEGDGASRRAAIKRLNAETDNQYRVIGIARALLSSRSEVERMREALERVAQVIDDGGSLDPVSSPTMVKVRAALSPMTGKP